MLSDDHMNTILWPQLVFHSATETDRVGIVPIGVEWDQSAIKWVMRFDLVDPPIRKYFDDEVRSEPHG
jgi:hypothetical protein